jgi:hypothetical protein
LNRVSPARNAEKRSGRRSSHNLAEEAAQAAKAEPVQDAPKAKANDEVTRQVQIPSRPPRAPSAAPEQRRRRSRPPPGELDGSTVKVNVPTPSDRSLPGPNPNEPYPRPADTRPRSVSATDEMDQWPTQALRQDELATIEAGHRLSSSYEVTGNVSQAMRVLIWQSPDGLRVAPAGTVVSAISTEAILVALDPTTDLAAWLNQKKK